MLYIILFAIAGALAAAIIAGGMMGMMNTDISTGALGAAAVIGAGTVVGGSVAIDKNIISSTSLLPQSLMSSSLASIPDMKVGLPNF